MNTIKTTIQITKIYDHGRCHEIYCDKILWLRKARNVGDIETVNNTQLGKLNEAVKTGTFEYIKL